jgi:hypothetical protein
MPGRSLLLRSASRIGAAAKGVIGGIQVAANGIRDGWSTGSQSRRRRVDVGLVADVVTWPLVSAGRASRRVLIPRPPTQGGPRQAGEQLLGEGAWRFLGDGRGVLC